MGRPTRLLLGLGYVRGIGSANQISERSLSKLRSTSSQRRSRQPQKRKMPTAFPWKKRTMAPWPHSRAGDCCFVFQRLERTLLLYLLIYSLSAFMFSEAGRKQKSFPRLFSSLLSVVYSIELLLLLLVSRWVLSFASLPSVFSILSQLY